MIQVKKWELKKLLIKGVGPMSCLLILGKEESVLKDEIKFEPK